MSTRCGSIGSFLSCQLAGRTTRQSLSLLARRDKRLLYPLGQIPLLRVLASAVAPNAIKTLDTRQHDHSISRCLYYACILWPDGALCIALRGTLRAQLGFILRPAFFLGGAGRCCEAIFDESSTPGRSIAFLLLRHREGTRATKQNKDDSRVVFANFMQRAQSRNRAIEVLPCN